MTTFQLRGPSGAALTLNLRGKVTVTAELQVTSRASVGLEGGAIRAEQGEMSASKTVSIDELPAISVRTILTLANPEAEGQLVESISVAWWEILARIARAPESIYEIDARTWEEVIAGAYAADGFEVILTPRSGDKGRDVIATRKGLYSVRFIDQVKAYKPGHVVTADEVRSLIGTLQLEGNASKAVLTTTSTFAPRLRETDPRIALLEPYRLELKDVDALLPWLEGIQQRSK